MNDTITSGRATVSSLEAWLKPYLLQEAEGRALARAGLVRDQATVVWLYRDLRDGLQFVEYVDIPGILPFAVELIVEVNPR